MCKKKITKKNTKKLNNEKKTIQKKEHFNTKSKQKNQPLLFQLRHWIEVQQQKKKVNWTTINTQYKFPLNTSYYAIELNIQKSHSGNSHETNSNNNWTFSSFFFI